MDKLALGLKSFRLSKNVIQVRNVAPMAKAHVLDLELIKEREQRKRKKLNKEIEQLLGVKKTARPVDEINLTVKQFRTLNSRIQPPFDVPDLLKVDRRITFKEFERSCTRATRNDLKWLSKITAKQSRVLEILKNLSPSLYEEAVRPEPKFKWVINGPAITPPIKGYEPPDGDYIKLTREFKAEDQITDPKLMKIWELAPGFNEMNETDIRLKKEKEERERKKKEDAVTGIKLRLQAEAKLRAKKAAESS